MTAPTRPRCARCQRPASHCLCRHIHPVSHRTTILILQHPDEQHHPLNTARLAALALERADIRIGHSFEDLPQRLARARAPCLLFPGSQAMTLPASSTGQMCPATWPDLLVVPDGTWRQAGRLVRSHTLLENLPRLVLPEGIPSRYRLRRAIRPGAVSTLEAIVRTLEIFEPDVDFQPVLHLFDVMIEQQIESMGEAAYARHLALQAAARGASH
ncbi:MAG: tRNA-uridine aminocarboxypropyltransferase [Corticimicrobacter sp.]|uniref:tRNA-uridine aminocarboxypropyltransferase n=1 Tax=Corticimicrobacter sp. TaxID=2678536 RepID=UPI0032DA3B02